MSDTDGIVQPNADSVPLSERLSLFRARMADLEVMTATGLTEYEGISHDEALEDVLRLWDGLDNYVSLTYLDSDGKVVTEQHGETHAQIDSSIEPCTPDHPCGWSQCHRTQNDSSGAQHSGRKDTP